MDHVRSSARLLKSKSACDLIIIDYLQLCDMNTGQKNRNREQEVAQATRKAKLLAKELNVPVIALSQLSRAAEKTAGRSDHRPQLSDLRDSGSIEQDADVVLFLYRAAYYNSQNGETEQANENEAECIVAKNRHGETSVVRLGWDGAHTRFSNLDEIHEQY
jgi:replicative DNA helicase